MRPMADDPNRDILPVKDDSCYGSVRCSSEIDPRERHIVCKLDRYELEDRYLRLLEEVQNLKKLSNSQEDKIKKLATKLMRAAASSRTCAAVIAASDDKDKIAKLEFENNKLKEKAYTLKSQLLSHRAPRSPSRCRHLPSGVSSGRTTYRSESARIKYQPPRREEIVNNDVQNYLVKIEELEKERNEMKSRIAELENQIAEHIVGIQREKIQDNVEYIRIWRQMKQDNEKLISVQAANETLQVQIGDLKKILEETTKNNRELTSALVSEKQQFSELEEKILSAKDSQLSLREKDEQIRNLTSEMKILQQHNSELIALSSKFSQVEIENVELKRKASEYAQENQNLKSAFNSEQALHTALRAANDKLIAKIEELQKNMDNLTVQLMQKREPDKRLVSKGTRTEIEGVDKNVETSFAMNEKKEQLSENVNDERDDDCRDFKRLNFSEKEFTQERAEEETKDRGRGENLPVSRSNSRSIFPRKIDSEMKQMQHPSMSREKMLKLLDQAQISTPLETQNAARMRQIDVATDQNDASKYPESYRSPTHSNDDFDWTNSPSRFCDELTKNREQSEYFDPKEILLMLFEILKSYSDKIKKIKSSSCVCDDWDSDKLMYRNRKSLKNEIADLDSTKSSEREKETTQTCAILYEELKNGLIVSIANSAEVESTKDQNLTHRFTETQCCACDSNQRCLATSDCGYSCHTPKTEYDLEILNKSSFSALSNPETEKPERVGKIGLTIEDAFDPTYSERSEPGKCKEILRAHNNLKISDKNELQRVICNCETDCRASNDSGDKPVFCEVTEFPMLITRGQGLIEIHILSLQLSTKATQVLFENNSQNISVFVSWDIWGQETAFTPILKYPSLGFDSSSVYRVCELENFFDSVLREQIVFQVHVINSEDDTFPLAKAKLSVRDILDYPQNKLHYVTPVLSVLPPSSGCNFGQLSLWIRLSCDIDLVENFKDSRGLVTTVSAHQQVGLPAQQPKKELEFSTETEKGKSSKNLYSEINNIPVRDVQESPQESNKNNFQMTNGSRLDTIHESAESIYRTKSDEQKFGEKNESKKGTADKKWSETNTEGKYSSISDLTIEYDSQDSDAEREETINAAAYGNLRLANLQKKLDNGEQVESRSITEFNNVLKNGPNGSTLHAAGSTINDLGTVISDEKWEQYKRNNDRPSISSQVKSEDPNVESSPEIYSKRNIPALKNTITISIVAMNLFANTTLMNNPDVHLLYIEYSFLGMRGADMETISLPKPKDKEESMIYNFTKNFHVDEEYHSSQRNILISMLSGTTNPNIRFVIVSEPLPEEMDTKECIEVGHADLHIREYALGDGLRDVSLIIMNPRQSEQFGILKITIDGIEIIRNCMVVQKRI